MTSRGDNQTETRLSLKSSPRLLNMRKGIYATPKHKSRLNCLSSKSRPANPPSNQSTKSNDNTIKTTIKHTMTQTMQKTLTQIAKQIDDKKNGYNTRCSYKTNDKTSNTNIQQTLNNAITQTPKPCGPLPRLLVPSPLLRPYFKK